MSELANNNEVRALAYLLAAACCYFAGRREARSPHRKRLDLFPAFWFITAGFLAVMGFGRLSQLGELLGYLGRAEAREAGWYEARRPFQAAAIMLITGGWFFVTAIAVWRVPERRRRYLPAAVLVFTLVCFAAVRAISLHQVDSLLYNYPVAGVRLASLLELSGLGAASLAALFSPQLAAWLLARGVGVPSPDDATERARSTEVPR